MNEKRELERHRKILEKIRNAKRKEELPSVSFANISVYLSNNVSIGKDNISQKEFKPVIMSFLKHGSFMHPDVIEEFTSVIHKNYPKILEEDILKKYNEIINSKKIEHILSEISLRNEKIDELNKIEKLNIHKKVMKDISSSFEIKDLPKVGLTELNTKILRAMNSNDFKKNYKTSDIRELTEAYLNGLVMFEIEKILNRIISEENISEDKKDLMKEQIIAALIMDESIDYTLEEMHAKEERISFIYKIDHEMMMDDIKYAHRISQLPSNISFSTLTNYLKGNSTIYTKDDRIKSEDLRHLTYLLLKGYKWEDEVIINELENIVIFRYPDKKDAFKLLYKKFTNLPRTYYLVEEINYTLSKQSEFIKNASNNVNIYFIPNEKSPIEGGKFYNCYISRADNPEKEKNISEKISELLKAGVDNSSIEINIQENLDDTFNPAGGIILKKDETIGNINTFRPNDGKVTIAPEDKKKMDEITDLDKEIEEKRKELSLIEQRLEERKRKEEQTEQHMKKLVNNYERKALELQMELMQRISDIKQDLGYTDEQDNSLKRNLKQ